MESQALPRDIILVVLIYLRSYDKIDSLSLRKVLYLFQKVVHNVERFFGHSGNLVWMTHVLIFSPGFPAIQNNLTKVGDVTKELFLSKK